MGKEKEIKKNTNAESNFIYLKISLLIFIILVLFSVYIGTKQLVSYENIIEKFNSLYDYSIIINFVKSNINYFIPLITAYIVFIGFISHKKVIPTTDSKNWTIFNLLGILYTGFDLILIFFLFELSKWKEFLIVLISSLVIGLFIVVITGSFRNIISDYKSLDLVKKWITKRNNKKELSEFEKGTFNTLNTLFSTLPYICKCLIFLSFIIIPIGMHFELNTLTILSIHFLIINTYVALSIVSSGIPATKGIIKCKDEELEGLITEYSKDRVMIQNSKEKYIFQKDKIDYIKIKN